VKEHTKRALFLFLGWLSIAVGIAGIFLPIVPTTPLAILAAWFFSRSSVRWHAWLLQHKIFGPTIATWEAHGVISSKAKTLATTMMVILFSYTLIFVDVNVLIKSVVSVIGICVLIFIWTRPSRAPHD
tara:strand:- start:28542 stop:28925 length:384 start_codon:yes stop_codon:yes gene_type:complete